MKMKINKLYKIPAVLLMSTLMLGVVSRSLEDHNLPVVASIKPKGPKPIFVPETHDKMWVVMEKLLSPVIPRSTQLQSKKLAGQAATLYLSKKYTTNQICEQLHIGSKATLYKYLRHEG
jgi:hypothetical protein